MTPRCTHTSTCMLPRKRQPSGANLKRQQRLRLEPRRCDDHGRPGGGGGLRGRRAEPVRVAVGAYRVRGSRHRGDGRRHGEARRSSSRSSSSSSSSSRGGGGGGGGRCRTAPTHTHSATIRVRVSEWSYREAAGGIPESAREPVSGIPRPDIQGVDSSPPLDRVLCASLTCPQTQAWPEPPPNP
jgi:hypothetical protein